METVKLRDARTGLPRLLTDGVVLGEVAVITRSGRRAGALLSIDECDGLLEFLEILAGFELGKPATCASPNPPGERP